METVSCRRDTYEGTLGPEKHAEASYLVLSPIHIQRRRLDRGLIPKLPGRQGIHDNNDVVLLCGKRETTLISVAATQMINACVLRQPCVTTFV